jgi:hypothetical protein
VGAHRRLLECEPDHKGIVGPDRAGGKKTALAAGTRAGASRDLTAFTRFRKPSDEVFFVGGERALALLATRSIAVERYG